LIRPDMGTARSSKSTRERDSETTKAVWLKCPLVLRAPTMSEDVVIFLVVGPRKVSSFGAVVRTLDIIVADIDVVSSRPPSCRRRHPRPPLRATTCSTSPPPRASSALRAPAADGGRRGAASGSRARRVNHRVEYCLHFGQTIRVFAQVV